MSNSKMLQYYTGLDHYRHFQYVLQSLGPAAGVPMESTSEDVDSQQ